MNKWTYDSDQTCYCDGTGTYDRGWYAVGRAGYECGTEPERGPFRQRGQAAKAAAEIDAYNAAQDELEDKTTPGKPATRGTILAALRAWIDQRPGLEYGNYGDPVSYRAELRGITRDKRDAQTLLTAVELSPVTVDQLKAGFRAYSGRLTWNEDGKGGGRLSYCTGQYWPTEYRQAACACLAAALWDAARVALPEGTDKPGDALRARFKRLFGRSIQRRWFD